MTFEWDEKKRRINLEKHDVDFEDAPRVFTEDEYFKRLDAMTDEEIDFSDIPPLTDEQLSAMKPLRDVFPDAVQKKSPDYPPLRFRCRLLVQRTSDSGRGR